MASQPPVQEPTRRRQFLGRLSLPERTFITDALRTETVGGVLLLLASVVALIWANVWPAAYQSVLDYTVGPSTPLHLDLSLDAWAKDGLLTIFFFVAGIELKREFVAGELRSPSAAILPVIAAVCGVALPAIVFAVANAGCRMGTRTAGPSRPPPTSPSRSACSPWSAATCPRRCAPSCSPSRWWTT